MRRISLALCGLMTMTGCTTTVSNPSFFDNVGSIARTLCLFVPTAGTVQGILNLKDETLSDAQEIAAAICAAIKVDPSAPGSPGGQPNVKGVVVNGSKVAAS